MRDDAQLNRKIPKWPCAGRLGQSQGWEQCDEDAAAESFLSQCQPELSYTQSPALYMHAHSRAGSPRRHSQHTHSQHFQIYSAERKNCLTTAASAPAQTPGSALPAQGAHRGMCSQHEREQRMGRTMAQSTSPCVCFNLCSSFCRLMEGGGDVLKG